MKKRMIEIPILVKCQQIGLNHDYFGNLQIGDKIFEFNFSIFSSVENLNNLEKTIGNYLRFLKSTSLDLFTYQGEKIPLDKKEAGFFTSIIVISLVLSKEKIYFELPFKIKTSIEKANLLTQKKFNCRINI